MDVYFTIAFFRLQYIEKRLIMQQCYEKQYPYPKECVFLVSIVKIENKNEGIAWDLNNIKTTIVVSRKAETAVSYFEKISPDSGLWKGFSCISLAEMAAIKAKLETAAKRPENYLTVETQGVLGKILSKVEPWFISYNENEPKTNKSIIIMASSANDISQWCISNKYDLVTVLPLSIIRHTVAEMESVQSGNANFEQYAYDYSNGEDMDNSFKRIEQWNEEEKKWAEDAFNSFINNRAAGDT